MYATRPLVGFAIHTTLPVATGERNVLSVFISGGKVGAALPLPPATSGPVLFPPPFADPELAPLLSAAPPGSPGDALLAKPPLPLAPHPAAPAAVAPAIAQRHKTDMRVTNGPLWLVRRPPARFLLAPMIPSPAASESR